MTQPAEILTFWFGTPELDAPVDEARNQAWFTRSDAFDQQIDERFGADVETALAGNMNTWRGELPGELALVLLCDQFTRNIYRGSKRAYSGDTLALDVALAVIGRGDDRKLGLYQRAFIGMPLEHSESPEIQRRSVTYFQRLRSDYLDGAQGAAAAESFYQYALAHQQVIEDFGRYPHRNTALGRASTDAEQQWLEQGGGF